MAEAPLFAIRNLHVSVDGKPVLKGLDLEIGAGEVHALVGPKGSGKSTLAQVLAGHEGCEVGAGEVLYQGVDLLGLAAEERARRGVFLAFQEPVAIPGVANGHFLRAAVNALRRHRGQAELGASDFLTLARSRLPLAGMDESLLDRPLNDGFSAGEKKRNEILQMLLLEPTLALLDESDAGLDGDTLKIVADAINRLRGPQRAIVLVSRHGRLLEQVEPDRVHVLVDGRFTASGSRELAAELERSGYGQADALPETLPARS